MFKLQPAPTFWASIEITAPGQAKAEKFEVEFKYKNRPDLEAFFDLNKTEGRTNLEALGELIVNWRGVDVPYSIEALGVLLDNYLSASSVLFETYQTEGMGQRRKN